LIEGGLRKVKTSDDLMTVKKARGSDSVGKPESRSLAFIEKASERLSQRAKHVPPEKLSPSPTPGASSQQSEEDLRCRAAGKVLSQAILSRIDPATSSAHPDAIEDQSSFEIFPKSGTSPLKALPVHLSSDIFVFLADSYCCEAFCTYCAREHCTENLDFLNASMAFRHLPDDRLEEEALRLKTNYIENSGEFSLNITQATQLLTLDKVNSALAAHDLLSLRSAFDDTKEEVVQLITTDTWWRFRCSAGPDMTELLLQLSLEAPPTL
jgi:hypothetical protein